MAFVPYQRAVVRDVGKVLVAYYFADRTYTDGPFHGEEANHRVPRRIAASLFDAESLSTAPPSADPYRKLEATAADFGNVGWNPKFYIENFDAGKHFVFKNLRFDLGLSAITLAVATGKGGGRIELRDGAIDGPWLGTLTTQATGGELTFREQSIPASALTGQHDIFYGSRAPWRPFAK